jgi:ankyrin repeat protein
MDSQQWTALHVASYAGSTSAVERLLQISTVRAAVCAATSTGYTPLHLACGQGRREVVPLLLAAGADVNAQTRDAGFTPLHSAVKAQSKSVVAALLAAGANPGTPSADGDTVLHVAAAVGNLAVMRLLLKAVVACEGTSIIDVAASGMTALHRAVEKGHTRCLKVLLAAGADPNKLYEAGAVGEQGESLQGATALHRAVQLERHAAAPLLATPANLCRVWKQDTPLHLAVWYQQVGVAQALMAAGSPVSLAGTDGHSAMSLAANSSSAVIRALLPAMVRGECERYLQLLEQKTSRPQQQQQQQGRREGQRERRQQQDPSFVLAVVADAISGLMETTGGSGLKRSSRQGVACFGAVLEVLGEADATRVLQLVLCQCWRATPQATARVCMLELVRVLHRGWLEGLGPLLLQRWEVTNPLWEAVTYPLQQQLRQQMQAEGEEDKAGPASNGVGAADGHQSGVAPKTKAQAATCGVQAAKRKAWAVTYGKASAAVRARQWPLFVHHLKHLTGRQPVTAAYHFSGLVANLVRDRQCGYLCFAQLAAWRAARQQAAAKARQELEVAVVAALLLARQQQ